MNIPNRITTMALCALLAGCAGSTSEDGDEIARLSNDGNVFAPGTPESEVRARMGEPRRVVSTAGGQRWTYAEGVAFERPQHAVVTTLTFAGGRLTGVESYSADD